MHNDAYGSRIGTFPDKISTPNTRPPDGNHQLKSRPPNDQFFKYPVSCELLAIYKRSFPIYPHIIGWF